MKICQEHWNVLKDAIKERGLYQFVTKSSDAALDEIKTQLEGTTDETKPYDPLMSANWGIVVHVAQIEPSLMFGEYCPLCEVEIAAGTGSAQNWINGCTDEILDDFRSHGWVANAN